RLQSKATHRLLPEPGHDNVARFFVALSPTKKSHRGPLTLLFSHVTIQSLNGKGGPTHHFFGDLEMNVADLTVVISKEIEIKAAAGTVFRNMIGQLSRIMGGDGNLMELTLEEWPGGRWFRDLGNGQGHLWGFVRVIKPPTLLEIYGPLMMSYPVAGHL